MVAPFDWQGDLFPGLINALSFGIAVSGNLTATSVSQQLSSSIFVGVYTRSASTLSLVNSASASFGNTNASTANTSRWNSVRMIQLTSGAWSKAPIFTPQQNLWLAVFLRSHVTTGAMSWMLAESIQTVYSGIIGNAALGASGQPFTPMAGRLSVSTSAIPASIVASDLVGTGALISFRPYFRMDNDLALY